eukprot:jgi/Chrzof1/5744/Cz16g14080.t1
MARQRRPAAVVDTLLTQAQPLDESEQQKVIEALQEQQLSQNRRFRAIFGTGALGLSLFFFCAATQQHAHPWEARYTGELRSVTQHQHVEAMLFLQGMAMLATAFGLLTQLPKKGEIDRGCMPAGSQIKAALWTGTAFALVGAVYWGTAWWRNYNKHGHIVGANWELLWLPFGPLTYSLICHHVIHTLTSTGQELQALQKMTYPLKAV